MAFRIGGGMASISSNVTLVNPNGPLEYGWGAAGVTTLRTASVLGNQNGEVDYGFGNVSGQTPRVVLADDQSPIPVGIVAGFPGGLATEATLQTLGTEATLQNILTALGGGLATETTLQDVLTALGLLGTEATLQNILTALGGGLATETTLQDVLTALGLLGTEATLQGLSAKLPPSLGPQNDGDSLSVTPSNSAIFINDPLKSTSVLGRAAGAGNTPASRVRATWNNNPPSQNRKELFIQNASTTATDLIFLFTGNAAGSAQMLVLRQYETFHVRNCSADIWIGSNVGSASVRIMELF